MNTADRLFATRLYAVTFWVQHNRPPLLAELVEAQRVSVVDAAHAVRGINYSRLRRRLERKRSKKAGAA